VPLQERFWPRRVAQDSCPAAGDFRRTKRGAPEPVCASVDSTKRKRLQWSSFHRGYMQKPLRSFPLSVLHENLQEVQEAACLFCPEIVRYVVDFSLDVSSPKPPKKASAAAMAHRRTL